MSAKKYHQNVILPTQYLYRTIFSIFCLSEEKTDLKTFYLPLNKT